MALKIEYIAVGDLRAYEKNARTHSPDQVTQIIDSINEFGFTNPVLIDENNELIAGHGRTQAAQAMGLEEVPAIRLTGLSDEQKRALRIADNKLALNAGWDYELLAEEIQELDLDGFDTSVIGFTDSEIDALLEGDFDALTAFDSGGDDEPEPEEYEPVDEEHETPEPQPDPVSVLGDVWLLGDHRVMCGDSTSIDDADKLMGDTKATLLLTDPPYNVSYVGKTADALTIQNDEMGNDDFRQFLRDAYSTADSVMEPGAAFYIWHADSEGYNFRGAAKDVGWQVRQCLIWKKNSLVLGRQDYHWIHEPCLYGWKDGAAHYWGSDRKQVTVLEFNRPTRSADHPTMKPVDLLEYQVMNSSKKGGVVLDLFGGSGSTLIACENTGRQCRMMELDPRYVDVIVKRWQNHTGEQAVLESTGQTFDEVMAERDAA